MKELLKKFQKAAQQVSDLKGSFDLFGLFLREEAPNRWDLLISADWAKEDEAAAINLLIEYLRKELSDKEILLLSKIVVLDEYDSILNTTNQMTIMKDNIVTLSDTVFSGIPIKKAYILAAQNTSSATV
ncbi:hypothetical protein [Candidatus Albibeggiatoa sp. nov. BB20]|uniref:hypothetical protein n=1 Tax=Candidatus Albibeggiatoa sp. nov. BB20 TaxID=3162723 RepID=UPI0033656AC4